MRILCLDIGTKRIGVAATDPMGWTAQPVSVILRRGAYAELAEIIALIKKSDVGKIVIGLPLNEESRESVATKKVRTYAAKLEETLKKENLDVPIEFWDERYSTKIAEERLIEADVSRARRKEVIDKMAAVVILEDYLAARDLNDEGSRG